MLSACILAESVQPCFYRGQGSRMREPEEGEVWVVKGGRIQNENV